MKNTPLTGLSHLIQGLKMLMLPGLRKYILAPLGINIVVFIIIGWLGYAQFDHLLSTLLPESSWLSFLRWILWPLFALSLLLITFYTFTALANLIAAPFNSILSAKVEEMITGHRPPEDRRQLRQVIIPSIMSELRKLGYFLIRAVPLLILFVIPGINLIAPFLWLLFSAWFLSIEYTDYPMGNHGLTFQSQHQRLKNRRMTALGFGGGITLLMMIPILNFAAMPAAVIGATRFWCEETANA
ncbi:sulfate transporter CysZ [Sedimenticola selenatireducens]|uniref:Sulfate transporter CysZ n=1 Tax=Sedimenticola selenatireducens TaxID=191960 RepID=A0A557RZJ5_9GAMM|nr:sulfate transporter CysZ [Sedimenticola selenatireducens]TVO70548.1 sulfate transporter CysZ [Sedimenticola selenatireducens]TVT63125.1 MAG: sulfate transporter CysZ [Sedimenticola selenatireducens]